MFGIPERVCGVYVDASYLVSRDVTDIEIVVVNADGDTLETVVLKKSVACDPPVGGNSVHYSMLDRKK